MKPILYILLFSSCAGAQRTSQATLAKYSYNIVGGMMVINTQTLDTSAHYFGGSAFFIRKGGSLYLVTAEHVLTGCDNQVKNSLYPDSLFVLIHTKYGDRLMTLDISALRDTVPCPTFYESPDLITVLIKDTLEKYVFSVEGMILPRFKKRKDAVIFGYPATKSILNGKYRPVAPSAIELMENKYVVTDGGQVDTGTAKQDKVNFWVFPGQAIIDHRGFSGSPFFEQDLKSKRWRVAGVFSGVSEGSKDGSKFFIVIPKIEFALENIDRGR